MGKHTVMAGWNDCGHLDEKTKATLLASIPKYQQDARSKGIPQLGSGAIYPVPETDISVKDFQIPAHWPRGFGFDVGWNRTAGIFAAFDRDSDILYLYSEHYRGEAEPAIHAAAMGARGKWIPGRIDPAARGRGQRDGEQLLIDYRNLGMNIRPAINAVESGIYKVWMRMSTGRLKVFESCQSWFGEFRIYRRDEKGVIVKVNDHLMDACLAPGTKVITESGRIAIEKLVGRNGKVLSRGGSWLNYTGARLTIKDAEVVTLEFSDRSTVTCTPDHKFLTTNGWVEAKDMAGVKCYNGVSQRNKVKSCVHSLYQAPFKSLKAPVTTYVENILDVMGLVCTGKYIKKIMERYRKAMMSIIKMRTGLITVLKTLNCLQEQNILEYTSEGIPEAYQKPLYQQQKNGTPATKVLSGTKTTIKKHLASCTQRTSSFVNAVRKNILQKSQEKIDSVVINVKQKREGYLVLTMKNAIAWFAMEAMWLIVMLKNKHAQENALVSCLVVIETGKSDVYCLTVPASSAFCIESGIVVHNTRYLVQEVETNDFMITKPIIRNETNILVPTYDTSVGY